MTKPREEQLELGNVSVRFAPWRGGLVSGLTVRGREVLFLDRQTLEDSGKSIRGGIPLLFPFASRIEKDRLEASGTQIPMHGFARNMAWTTEPDGGAGLRMFLQSDAETEAIFPWPFHLEQSCLILADGLHVELLIHNLHEESPMPVAPGWHPYFACPAGEKEKVSGNFAGTEAGFFHDREQVNFGLRPPMNGKTIFQIPGLGRVHLRFSPKMHFLQLWTLPGKDFVCIEPFSGPPNFINTDRAELIPPGEARSYWMRIEVD